MLFPEGYNRQSLKKGKITIIIKSNYQIKQRILFVIATPTWNIITMKIQSRWKLLKRWRYVRCSTKLLLPVYHWISEKWMSKDFVDTWKWKKKIEEEAETSLVVKMKMTLDKYMQCFIIKWLETNSHWRNALYRHRREK